jgi:phosphatidylserine decarboxylase
MKYSEPIAREGLVFILPTAGLALAGYYFHLLPLTVAATAFVCFSLFFFRNPRRRVPEREDIAVSPADGRIMRISTTAPDAFREEEMLKISIFLSIFNVHINRIPVAGRVVFTHQDGTSYLPAYQAEAGKKNVRRYLGLHTAWGPVLVVQITGLVARRIVNRAQVGDVYASGERFGLIRFGSCTEVYLPVNCELMVREGQTVKGGESILARLI